MAVMLMSRFFGALTLRMSHVVREVRDLLNSVDGHVGCEDDPLMSMDHDLNRDTVNRSPKDNDLENHPS